MTPFNQHHTLTPPPTSSAICSPEPEKPSPNGREKAFFRLSLSERWHLVATNHESTGRLHPCTKHKQTFSHAQNMPYHVHQAPHKQIMPHTSNNSSHMHKACTNTQHDMPWQAQACTPWHATQGGREGIFVCVQDAAAEWQLIYACAFGMPHGMFHAISACGPLRRPSRWIAPSETSPLPICRQSAGSLSQFQSETVT